MILSGRLVLSIACFMLPGCGAMQVTATASPFQDPGVEALDGEWIFVEDRTEGRAIEQQQPSMSARVRLRVEKDAVVLIRRAEEIRIPLDGSPTDVTIEGRVSTYRGAWKDNAFEYQSERAGEPDKSQGSLIRWVLRPTGEGLIAHVAVGSPPTFESIALYRHPDDIAMPEPAKAAIGDVAWLAGNWSGARGRSSVEERWGPPRGGAMLGVSQTVSGERMVAFEYLRIVEREGGLVYIAQPGGTSPTEFILTELNGTRAVFENPRHDSPQRIVYEVSAEGVLTASIGYIKGGSPRQFVFHRAGD